MREDVHSGAHLLALLSAALSLWELTAGSNQTIRRPVTRSGYRTTRKMALLRNHDVHIAESRLSYHVPVNIVCAVCIV